MLRALRIFLVILLTLTLPVQGVSAAAMTMRVGGDISGHANALTTVEAGTDCHGMGAAATEPAQTGQAEHASPGSFKTKACSGCCTGAMLSAPVLPAIGPLPAGNRYLAQHYRAPTGFIPDGPERPPKHFS